MTKQDKIIYRFASKEDADQIYDFAMKAMVGTSLPEFAKDAGEGLQDRIIDGDPNNILLAIDQDQGNIIAYVEVEKSYSPKINAFYIRGIYVLPDYRRIGVGRKLLSIIKKEKCTSHEELRVNAFTTDGLRFWEAYGFKVHHYSLFYDHKG
ncbi:MAG: GNAT family N-acetyltransferase [Candidatus Heimdallarchaeota archaeon]|nr:GNAT family N-acetyltransferase [Candidatus Heimdallarchaeota archaeon]